MRRKIILGLVMMLVLSSINIISGNVSAELKKEDMASWSIGDKWDLRSTTNSTNMSMVFTMAIEITGESNISIDDVNYDVFVGQLSGEIENIDIPSLQMPMSLAPGSTVSGTMYVAKNNFDSTKTIENLEYQLRQEASGVSINFSQTLTTTNRVISGSPPDVIDVGTIWNMTTKTIQTTTMTISYPGYTNTTTSTNETVETFNNECIGKENITTPAGTFECYKNRQNKVGETGYSIQYESSDVKFDVKETTYDGNGNILSNTELISYTHGSAPPPQSTKKKTPGFELLIVFCSIAMILLLKRKKLK